MLGSALETPSPHTSGGGGKGQGGDATQQQQAGGEQPQQQQQQSQQQQQQQAQPSVRLRLLGGKPPSRAELAERAAGLEERLAARSAAAVHKAAQQAELEALAEGLLARARASHGGAFELSLRLNDAQRGMQARGCGGGGGWVVCVWGGGMAPGPRQQQARPPPHPSPAHNHTQASLAA